MAFFDWIILLGSLVFIVAYGVWKGRKNRNLDDYILADRSLKWYTIALSIMATQASAITFISTPGQAYTDGMRFVQFYFGLPIGMVILSVTAVPIYHRLKVYTAYEYLEGRFDLKTRSLAAFLFLIQRGLAAGLTIFAPALILSMILGWNLYLTNLVIGGLVVIYTALGGTKAVSWTNFHQLLIAMGGMVAAFIVVLLFLPSEVSFGQALSVAGRLGKLNAVDFSFDLQNRYSFWSGVIGGMFLQLSYFGTDQSQVQRYLTGKSIAQSRIALLFNGMVKIPMQFFILLVGAMVFVFYQFVTPPIFFNPVARQAVIESELGEEFRALEEQHEIAARVRATEARAFARALEQGDERLAETKERDLLEAYAAVGEIREQALEVMRRHNPRADTNDTNFIFLSFVMSYLPVGLVGLIIAAVFAASMSSTASELNALASTTVVDIYKRMFRADGSDTHYVRVSKLFTVFWGGVAIAFAMFANRLGTLVEAVNILGSIFYGTILGIFLTAFYLKRVGATAVFSAALVAQAVVVYSRFWTDIAWLWYNVIGCMTVVIAASIIQVLLTRRVHSS
jgi:solute:Na+ symporter, SSS family